MSKLIHCNVLDRSIMAFGKDLGGVSIGTCAHDSTTLPLPAAALLDEDLKTLDHLKQSEGLGTLTHAFKVWILQTKVHLVYGF